jgi:subtilisin family serine protease
MAWLVFKSRVSQVKVGLIDSGVTSHEDLDNNLVYASNFVSNNTDATDNSPTGHGSRVAGIVGAVGNNGIGISGVAQKVSLVSCRVTDSNGTSTVVDAIVAAIRYARTQGIPIINLSLGTTAGYYQSIRNEISLYTGLVVCGAGNSTNNNDITPFYPASYNMSNMIAVAAIGFHNNLASYSNYGATSVHIGAPGSEIYSTTPKTVNASGYSNNVDGTSYAAPHVAGVAALLKGTFPYATTSQIREAILSSAVYTPSLNGKVSTNGRLDAYAALNYLEKKINRYDVNRDGIVDVLDLALVLIYVGRCEESTPEWSNYYIALDNRSAPIYSYHCDVGHGLQPNSVSVVDMCDVLDIYINYT